MSTHAIETIGLGKTYGTVRALSIFHLYGTPMQPDWSSTGAWVMLALSIVFVGLAVIGFRQRDLAR
jgi:hypothetical protein